VWIVSGTRPGYVLEPPDQSARCFLVSIMLKWLFFKHTHKVFDEMLVRTYAVFWFDFAVDFARVLAGIDLCFRCGF
jgi:hypothetical protein